jgi:competence protein ComGC
MKPCWQKRVGKAFTLIDLLVIIAVLAILMAMLLSMRDSGDWRATRIACVSNLKQVNLSFRIWEGDNNNKYPMAVSVTNGGAMEWIATNDVATCFRVMSNELSTPRILICPADLKRIFATNFDSDFNASHVSYFIGVDASNEDYPQRLLSGDDNFQINGTRVGSGVLSLSTNVPLEWGPGRHGDDPNRHFWTPPPKHFVGNLGFADGSVAEESDSGLFNSLKLTGLATNRLAIP